MRPQPGHANVMKDGRVIVSGDQVGQVVQLRNSRWWIYRPTLGDPTGPQQNKTVLLDEVFGAGRWS